MVALTARPSPMAAATAALMAPNSARESTLLGDRKAAMRIGRL
ncbi:hypothetical protein [Rugamonas sp. DEMB1]|nr:hypothetical protein [Rugamonas sp. DEMB1]WGG48507.1 hypothetical protein QC826_17625 [Rugamonas sp. DEMB1]